MIAEQEGSGETKPMFLKHRSKFLSAQEALERNDYASADAQLSEILASDPEAPEILLHRALARMRLGQLDEAYADTQKFVELRPENPLGLMIQGEVLLEQKNFAEAETVLKKAAEMEKDNGRTFYGLGRAYAALGKKAEAGDCFEIALQFERDYTMSQFMAEMLSARN
jgi:predicted Zn-dependent protease